MSKLLTVLILVITYSASAAERKNIFVDPQNLKILPENISPADLRDTMKSFSMGLGLRCSNCHVGEEGKPLSTFEFDKDDKKLKQKARVMLKMVADINQKQLSKLDQIEKRKGVEVQCVTCHRGQQKPELIQNVLAETYAEKGMEKMIEKYVSLRTEYYGSHSYDFSETVLPLFSGSFLNKENQKLDAIALLKKNLEYFPESFFGTFSLATAYHQAGEPEKAKTYYKKALTINPKAVFINARLKQLLKSK